MELKKLISQIEVVYEVLHGLPLDLDFYEKYHEYKILANKIEKLAHIDKEKIEEDDSCESFMQDSLFGYVHFKLFPLFQFMEKNKDMFFLKFPEDEIFNQVKHCFLKLAKMDEDERYPYWLDKTNKTFDDFLGQVKTTEKGNRLFMDTNVMNAIPEIDTLYRHIQKDRKSKKTYLERIDEGDPHGLMLKVNKLAETMGKGDKNEFSFSLRHKGKTDYINFYDRNRLTKDEMLEPVKLFHARIKLLANGDNASLRRDYSVKFDSELSKVICGDIEVKVTKGKDTYYIIKYLFEKKNIYEECFYDEVRDYSDLDDFKKKTDKNIYDSLIQFNKRLIKQGINDLFIISFRSVKINSKYNISAL
jgi:hypothetical protein